MGAIPAPSSIRFCYVDMAPSFVTYQRLHSRSRHIFLVASQAAKKRKNGLSEAATSSLGNSTRLDATATHGHHAESVQQLVCQSEDNHRWFHLICQCQQTDQDVTQEEGNKDFEDTWGVKVALVALNFYRREISSFLPSSCRYVPTCSQYSMQAYKRYGVWKGTILTAWRIARCNPFGGSGYDPPAGLARCKIIRLKVACRKVLESWTLGKAQV